MRPKVSNLLPGLKARAISVFGRRLSDLKPMLWSRDIALVGNAQSVFDEKRPIDDHEVVIRINRGVFVPQERREAGKRTDLLLVATDLQECDYFSAASEIVWMSPKQRETLSIERAKKYYFYPNAWWREVHQAVGARPSSGCLGVDMITRLAGPSARLTLYGFDFWQSETWYTAEKWIGPHSPNDEKKFIEGKLATLNSPAE